MNVKLPNLQIAEFEARKSERRTAHSLWFHTIVVSLPTDLLPVNIFLGIVPVRRLYRNLILSS
jgi:hypothetical protein